MYKKICTIIAQRESLLRQGRNDELEIKILIYFHSRVFRTKLGSSSSYLCFLNQKFLYFYRGPTFLSRTRMCARSATVHQMVSEDDDDDDDDDHDNDDDDDNDDNDDDDDNESGMRCPSCGSCPLLCRLSRLLSSLILPPP